MSNSQPYFIRYPAILEQNDLSPNDLPGELQELIKRFLLAVAAWNKSDSRIKDSLLPALVQTDAFISATIERLTLSQDDIDKIKLMALKAKALKQKWVK